MVRGPLLALQVAQAAALVKEKRRSAERLRRQGGARPGSPTSAGSPCSVGGGGGGGSSSSFFSTTRTSADSVLPTRTLLSDSTLGPGFNNATATTAGSGCATARSPLTPMVAQRLAAGSALVSLPATDEGTCGGGGGAGSSDGATGGGGGDPLGSQNLA